MSFTSTLAKLSFSLKMAILNGSLTSEPPNVAKLLSTPISPAKSRSAARSRRKPFSMRWAPFYRDLIHANLDIALRGTSPIVSLICSPRLIMSLLSRDLDSFISERDFEAAKSAIQKASVRIKNKAASPNWEDRLPQLIVPPRTPEDAVGALRYLEDVYATKDWTTLKETLDLLEPALPKKLPEYTSRKLFAAAMIADPSAMSNLYAQIADHLALDPANGDLYLAMGALKLAELSLVDCRFLLELATKCPIYHPLMLPILLEKLNWSESACTQRDLLSILFLE